MHMHQLLQIHLFTQSCIASVKTTTRTRTTMKQKNYQTLRLANNKLYSQHNEDDDDHHDDDE